jgi:multiple antibiotic resistance protein
MHFQVYITLFVALIAITNPIGAIAIFTGLMEGRSIANQKKEALKAAIAIFIILLIITWAGDYVLKGFGISKSAFEVGGGLIVILLGLSMINAHGTNSHSTQNHSNAEQKEAQQKESVAVVPMAIPLVAGPGAITTIIIHVGTMPGPVVIDKLFTSIICLIIGVIFAICFYSSRLFFKILGVSGIKIATRVMGLVLVAIAFTMIQQGLGIMFPGWLS